MRGCGNRLSMVSGAQRACNKGRLPFPSAFPVASAAEPWCLSSAPHQAKMQTEVFLWSK